MIQQGLIVAWSLVAWYIACRMTVDQSHISHNAPVPYPTMHYSEHKCAHFCSEWCIVGYGTGALWDMWDWSIGMIEHRSYFETTKDSLYHTHRACLFWVYGGKIDHSVTELYYCLIYCMFYLLCLFTFWIWGPASWKFKPKTCLEYLLHQNDFLWLW